MTDLLIDKKYTNHVMDRLPNNINGNHTTDILVRAECVCCPWLLSETKVATILGIYLLLLPPLFKIPEGVVVGFQICAWDSN
jgi:hypothetical protein